MKRSIRFAWMVVFILTACTNPAETTSPVQPSLTPSPEPTQTASTTPTASATPTSNPTATPRPTSTPRPSPTPTPEGYYVHESAAFSLVYPQGWKVTEEDDTSVEIEDKTGNLYFTGISGTEEQDVSTDELITGLENSFGTTMEQETNDEFTLQDGTIAERRVMKLKLEGLEFSIHLVRAQKGSRDYIFMGMGLNPTFTNRIGEIQGMFESIELRSGLVYGVERDQALVLEGGDPYPESLDPAQTQGSAAGYIGHLFSGLVRLSPQAQLEPDLAESWTISPDGRTYTFTLRSDTAFQSGSPLTAQDVKYSWERAADPDTDSPTAATYLGDILGVQEKLDGEADEIEGVQVIDDRTLVVQLDGPKPYFLAKLTYPTSYIVDQDDVEKDPDEWMYDPNASGPFGIREFREEESIVFERNYFYHTPPAIQYIVYLLYRAGTSLSMYQAGEIDITGVAKSDVKRILEDPQDPLADEMVSTTSMCTSMIQLNNTRPPMDDLEFRRAMVLAIDQDRINELFSENLNVIATSILPPAMPGYQQGDTVTTYNPDAARAALANSRYADDPVEIVLDASGYGDSDSPYLTAIVDMWRETLGIEVSIEYVNPRERTQGLRDAEGHAVSAGWCADYPDPENFLDVLFHSESIFNSANYVNSEVDALLEVARVELDPNQRLALYQQIQSLLMEDYAAILTTHGVSYTLVNPRIQGYVESPLGAPIVHLLSIANQE